MVVKSFYHHKFEDGYQTRLLKIPVLDMTGVEMLDTNGMIFPGDSWDEWCNLTGIEMVKLYQEVGILAVKELIVCELESRRKDDVWTKSHTDNQWEIAYQLLVKGLVKG